MSGCCFYMCKLFFFFGQLISLHIVATYVYVTLPSSKPTSNGTLNIVIVALNYLLHFVFISLH